MFEAARKYGHYKDIPEKMAPQPEPPQVTGAGKKPRVGRRRRREMQGQ